MSYMDNGEDEVDYGEGEIEDHSAGPPSFHPEGSSFVQDQAMVEEEEDYEDLYDDVNIGHFEPSSDMFSKKKPGGGAGAFGSGALDEDDGIGDAAGAAIPFPPVKHEALAVQGNQAKLAPIKQEDANHVESDVPGLAQQQGVASKAHAGASVVALSSSQTRPKDDKDQGAAWCLESSKQVKDEVNLSVKGPNQKALTSLPYLSQARRSITELSAVVGQRGKGSEYVGEDEGGISGTLVHSDARGRLPGRVMDEERGPVIAGRPVNRDASAVPPNDYTSRSGVSSQLADGGGSGGGATMLFVGDLEWWTTDAELEAALSEFGSVKTLKFFEERASGKSKGYCQVEFYDHSAAVACKEGMNGRKFHGRACVVAFANPRTIMQLGNAQVSKAQAQIQAQQSQLQSRRTMIDNGGSNRGGTSYQGGDGSSRSYGRPMGGRSGSSHGMGTGGRGSGRGRTNIGSKGMIGNGGAGTGGAGYGQGIVGPMGSHPSGLIMPQAMLGQGYDAGYGPPRGATGYGGYALPGPPFTGMMPPFPPMGPGTIAGVAPHVNPAFFSRNGMMAGNGMDGSLWGDANMNAWGTDEPDRRAREVGYGGDMGGSDYGYSNEMNYEKGRGASRDKDWERASDGDWQEKWRDREMEKEQRYKARDIYRERDDDDWERERSSRPRNRSRMIDEEEKEDLHFRSRDEDYGKRRRMGSERKDYGSL